MLKKKVICVLGMLFSLFAVSKDTSKYVIGHWPGGMGVCLHSLLNHLVYCEKGGLTPVVYWRGYYYDPRGFNGATNEWEYYFKQTSRLAYTAGDVVNHYCPNGGGSFSYYDVSPEKRNLANRLIHKYIHLNPVVQRKFDLFCSEYMQDKCTIGIHIRGTDKYTEEKPVLPEQAVEEALKYAKNGTQFFVASDEQKILDRMVELLQGWPVVYYDCYRSDNGKPLHTRKLKPPVCQLGEDVIVEMWIMSVCDVLIHTKSNVSAIPLYINPKLRDVTVYQQ